MISYRREKGNYKLVKIDADFSPYAGRVLTHAGSGTNVVKRGILTMVGKKSSNGSLSGRCEKMRTNMYFLSLHKEGPYRTADEDNRRLLYRENCCHCVKVPPATQFMLYGQDNEECNGERFATKATSKEVGEFGKLCGKSRSRADCKVLKRNLLTGPMQAPVKQGMTYHSQKVTCARQDNLIVRSARGEVDSPNDAGCSGLSLSGLVGRISNWFEVNYGIHDPKYDRVFLEQKATEMNEQGVNHSQRKYAEQIDVSAGVRFFSQRYCSVHCKNHQ